MGIGAYSLRLLLKSARFSHSPRACGHWRSRQRARPDGGLADARDKDPFAGRAWRPPPRAPTARADTITLHVQASTAGIRPSAQRKWVFPPPHVLRAYSSSSPIPSRYVKEDRRKVEGRPLNLPRFVGHRVSTASKEQEQEKHCSRAKSAARSAGANQRGTAGADPRGVRPRLQQRCR